MYITQQFLAPSYHGTWVSAVDLEKSFLSTFRPERIKRVLLKRHNHNRPIHRGQDM